MTALCSISELSDLCTLFRLEGFLVKSDCLIDTFNWNWLRTLQFYPVRFFNSRLPSKHAHVYRRNVKFDKGMNTYRLKDARSEGLKREVLSNFIVSTLLCRWCSVTSWMILEIDIQVDLVMVTLSVHLYIIDKDVLFWNIIQCQCIMVHCYLYAIHVLIL